MKKPMKHVALISDEVASSHRYLERETETEARCVHMLNGECGHMKER